MPRGKNAILRKAAPGRAAPKVRRLFAKGLGPWYGAGTGEGRRKRLTLPSLTTSFIKKSGVQKNHRILNDWDISAELFAEAEADEAIDGEGVTEFFAVRFEESLDRGVRILDESLFQEATL
jgi:hypothetical protein